MNSLIFNNSSSANLDEANGNLMGTIVPTTNNDDESLSVSEYTDNEKSAPTELLAEFLTSIMKKDYENALKYCKLILDYEPTNKTAKDFYPQLLAKVNEQRSTSSDGSDENCNYTSSLEFVDNEILDNENDMDNISQSSSSITSSISSNDNSRSDLASLSDDVDRRERDDLINSLSHSSSRSSNLSKSDQLPESMASTSSNKQNTSSNSFSFTSLLLDDSDDVNNNEPSSAPVEVVAAVASQNPSSPFTSKIMQMFKGKWDAAGSPAKHN